MIQENGDSSLKAMEHRAEELMTLTIEVCEERLAFGKAQMNAPKKALAEAAMGVRQSIKTFLAVSKIPGDTDQCG